MPPTYSPLPGSRLSCVTASPSSPRTSSAFQSTCLSVFDTTYFLLALIVCREGFHPRRSCSRGNRRAPRGLHHFVGHAPQKKGIGLLNDLGRVTMHVFVRRDCTMIAAAVQRDIDGVAKRTHLATVPAY